MQQQAVAARNARLKLTSGVVYPFKGPQAYCMYNIIRRRVVVIGGVAFPAGIGKKYLMMTQDDLRLAIGCRCLS